jgi:hypothetical protein
VQSGVAANVNQRVAINTAVAANLVAIGADPIPGGTLTDIIFSSPLTVTIDNDNPNPPTLTVGQFVEPNVDVIIGGQASDPTSYIALVEVSVNGGAFAPATGTSIWAFPLSIPNQPSGNISIVVRATDAVGFTRSASFNVTIDSVAPVTTIDLAPGDTRTLRRNAEGAWTLPLTGNSNDALAGLQEVEVQIGNNLAVTVPITVGIPAWELVYPFDDLSLNNDAQPTGPITATIITRDNALPNGNATVQEIPFVLDMTPPVVELLSLLGDEQLTDGAVLTGTVQDEYTAVSPSKSPLSPPKPSSARAKPISACP